MEFILNKILPVILGYVLGIITPFIKWSIEKKREKLRYKRDMIKSWREYINVNFNWDTFRDTSVFSEMKPHLSMNIIKEIDPANFEDGKVVINIRSPIGRDSLKSRLLDEIIDIERKWKLV